MILTNLVKKLNSVYNGLELRESDFSGYLVKKITHSTTIAVNKNSNQYHIDLTDINGPMRLFPIVASSESLDNYSSNRKKDFNLRLYLTLYQSNLNDLFSDLSKRSSAQSLTLKNPLNRLTSKLSTVFPDGDSVESFTYCTYSKRSAGQHQIEIGTSGDDEAFLLLRALLLPNDYIIFLKHKNKIEYDIFGIQESKYNALFSSIIGSKIFEEKDDSSPVSSKLIRPIEPGNTDSLNRILFGPPGTGKSTIVNALISDGDNYRITFHPDTDYISFVGGYKPTPISDDRITYSYVPQVFTNAYLRAWENPLTLTYLVIEEINRGNCAQIFGDIFQLLDRDAEGFSDYYITVESDMADYLKTYFSEPSRNLSKVYYLEKMKEKYKSDNFTRIALPPNLIILATMNTSDQSLFPMDSAFKRRWHWEYVPIDYEIAKNVNLVIDDKHIYNWGIFLEKINAEILNITHSDDKQLGNWFVKPNNGIVSFDLFRSKIMFYLWSEICKDEYQTERNLFKIRLLDGTITDFTFNDLFAGYKSQIESIPPESLVIKFLEYHSI